MISWRLHSFLVLGKLWQGRANSLGLRVSPARTYKPPTEEFRLPFQNHYYGIFCQVQIGPDKAMP